MLNLLIAESALETIPQDIWHEKNIISSIKTRQKKPSEILLDRSLHHRAMLNLEDAHKRGRPDLIHTTILASTSTPLYLQKKMQIYIHTYTSKVLKINLGVRPPKSYFRFQGLIEQILSHIDNQQTLSPLIAVQQMVFSDLIEEINPDIIIGFSRSGKSLPIKSWLDRCVNATNPVFIIGGFPKGCFSNSIIKNLDLLVSIHNLPLEAHVVTSRILYEYEKSVTVDL